MRQRFAQGVVPVVLALCVLLAFSASAASARSKSRHHHPTKVHRVGGRVHRAWPHGGHAPKGGALARWLARQVGPTLPRRCRPRRVHGRKVSCRHRTIAKRAADLGATANLASAGGVSGRQMSSMLATSASPGLGSLQLVRSYAIPTDDPSYARLLNWSWTYDSAVTAAAFSAAGCSSQAQQLLDQLAALQRTDGSIEFAFNTATGDSAPLFRAGTIAWVGLAGAIYDQDFGSSRYLSMQKLAADYLLTVRGSNGLIRGGPDVSWSSTQHNLLAYALLARLGNELFAAGDTANAIKYQSAAADIAAAIDSNLIVRNGSTAYFIEGLRDTVQALDVQALGAMYLQSRGQSTLAAQVLAYAEKAFAVNGSKIALSSQTATYNMTYSASRSFNGFVPYVGANAPAVLWPEGSAEVGLASAVLSQSSSSINNQLDAMAKVTASTGGALLQADNTVTSAAYGVEYHVWPAAAAAGWQLLDEQSTTPLLFPQVGSYPSAVLADNPELYYRLGENSGTTAVDSSTFSNPGVYQGGATHGTPGVTADGDTAVTLDGTSGYVSNATRWFYQLAFTEEAWIKTTTATGGAIIGLGDTSTGAPGNFDRMIYMGGTGQLYFGVAVNQTVHSSNAYNDGSWHLVDASLSSAGMALYVDGALVASNPKVTLPQLYSGYWRIGYDSTTGWTGHLNNFFTGSIDEAAVYPTALPPARVGAHYLAAG